MSEKTKSPSSHTKDLTRRSALKLSLVALAAGCITRSLFQTTVAHAAEALEQKPLIAYYSRTGNTRSIAEHIHRRMGGELFEVRSTHSYPEAHRATTEQARRELDSNFRPTLAAQVENMETYKVVFIGYPNWWGTLPMALWSFLESYAMSDKTIIPFCTHEGSGLGRGPADIAKLCPGVRMLEGFSVRGSRAASAQSSVDNWLKNSNLV